MVTMMAPAIMVPAASAPTIMMAAASAALARHSIARVEALDGTEPARREDIREDRWVRMVPGSV